MNLTDAQVRELEWWLAEWAGGDLHPVTLCAGVARSLERRGLCVLRETGGSVSALRMAEIRAALREYYAWRRSERSRKVEMVREGAGVLAFGAIVVSGWILIGAF